MIKKSFHIQRKGLPTSYINVRYLIVIVWIVCWLKLPEQQHIALFCINTAAQFKVRNNR